MSLLLNRVSLTGNMSLQVDGPPPPAGDPYWSNVSLLTTFDGTEGSQTFTDISTNAFTLTNEGTALTVDTSIKKFGTGSLKSTNTGITSRIRIPSDADFTLTGDFTLEGWFYHEYTTGTVTILGSDYNGGINHFAQVHVAGQNWRTVGMFNGVGGLQYVSMPDDIINTWFHLAFVRSGSTVTIYVNGISLGSFTNSSTYNFTNGAIGGQTGYPVSPTKWHLDELRLTKGVARYTANFTPPTEAFPTF